MTRGLALAARLLGGATIMPNTVNLEWDTDVFAAPTTSTATQYVLSDANGYTQTVFTGTGFTYDVHGVPTGGTITSVSMVAIDGSQVLATLSNLHVSLADYGTLMNSFLSLRDQISWVGVVGDGDLVDFTSTHIRLANTDGTFTDYNGTAFLQSGEQLTGQVTSIQHIGANGTTVLETVNTNVTLEVGAGALFVWNASTSLYNLLQTGSNTLTGIPSGPILVNGGTVQLEASLPDGPGDDTIVGSTGNNFVDYGDHAVSAVTVNLLTGTSTGGGGNDTLTNILGAGGSQFDDTITGNNSGNILLGNNGDDTIVGGTGNDWLSGEDGNDSIDGGAGVDTVAFQGDSETGVTIDLNITGPQNTGGSGTDTLINVENLWGGNYADDFTGNAGANVLNGNGGNDILEPGAGKDAVYGGEGDDRINVDVMASGPGNVETIDGGNGNDTLYVDSATGTILAGHTISSIENLQFSPIATFAAFLFGQIGGGLASNATITGGAGANNLIFIGPAPGAYSLAGTAFNFVNWTAGVDMITLTGAYATAPGNYALTGSSNAENLVGGAGNDTLSGGGGNDLLHGGGGGDSVDGGGGIDTYAITPGAIDTNPDNDTYQFHVTDLAGSTFANLENLAISASGPSWVTITSSQLAGFGANANIYAGSSNESDVLHVVMNTTTLDLSGFTLNNWQSVTDWSAINGPQGLFPGFLDAVVIDGTNGADSIIGTSGGDVIDADQSSSGGNDTVHGGDGNDIIDGWSGTNQMFGDAGNDTLQVYDEDWSGSGGLDGGSGTDTLQTHGTIDLSGATLASLERLEIWGSDSPFANGVILTFSAAGVAAGFASNMAISGSSESDTIIINGATTLSLANWTFSNWTAGVDAIALNGGAGGDTLTGSSVDDRIDGGAGADTLYGGAGNDQFYAGPGGSADGAADDMYGGTGDDRYGVFEAGDVVHENLGEGTDQVAAWVNYTLADNVENGALYGTATTLTGNALANGLSGNALANVLDGGTGADAMDGGLGNDIYYVDNAGDVVTENAFEGTDTIRSTIGIAALAANVENLELLNAVATGNGNGLDNKITGNAANNALNGAAGADTLIGGAGNDTYFVDNAGDVVTENASEGTDQVFAQVSFALSANVENLTLQGTALNATGNALNNVLTGDAQKNLLNGAGGEDTLAGGLDSDTYVYNSAG
ncbi:MAG TPA: hypothetical protein VG943_09430, partial [Caulobacterales bacterium]|nr:hypothetical protein [Caulobacterales bacterium]